MAKLKKGFYIVNENNKYKMIPNQGHITDAIAYATTTADIENILIGIASRNIVNSNFSTINYELEKLDDFPIIQRTLELIFHTPMALATLNSLSLGGNNYELC